MGTASVETANGLLAVVETARPLLGDEWQGMLTRLSECATAIRGAADNVDRMVAEEATEDLVAMALHFAADPGTNRTVASEVRARANALQAALATLTAAN